MKLANNKLRQPGSQPSATLADIPTYDIRTRAVTLLGALVVLPVIPGIMAIIHSRRVKRCLAADDTMAARRASNYAETWAQIALYTIICAVLAAVLWSLVVAFSSSAALWLRALGMAVAVVVVGIAWIAIFLDRLPKPKRMNYNSSGGIINTGLSWNGVGFTSSSSSSRASRRRGGRLGMFGGGSSSGSSSSSDGGGWFSGGSSSGSSSSSSGGGGLFGGGSSSSKNDSSPSIGAWVASQQKKSKGGRGGKRGRR